MIGKTFGYLYLKSLSNDYMEPSKDIYSKDDLINSPNFYLAFQLDNPYVDFTNSYSREAWFIRMEDNSNKTVLGKQISVAKFAYGETFVIIFATTQVRPKKYLTIKEYESFGRFYDYTGHSDPGSTQEQDVPPREEIARNLNDFIGQKYLRDFEYHTSDVTPNSEESEESEESSDFDIPNEEFISKLSEFLSQRFSEENQVPSKEVVSSYLEKFMSDRLQNCEQGGLSKGWMMANLPEFLAHRLQDSEAGVVPTVVVKSHLTDFIGQMAQNIEEIPQSDEPDVPPRETVAENLNNLVIETLNNFIGQVKGLPDLISDDEAESLVVTGTSIPIPIQISETETNTEEVEESKESEESDDLNEFEVEEETHASQKHEEVEEEEVEEEEAEVEEEETQQTPSKAFTGWFGWSKTKND